MTIFSPYVYIILKNRALSINLNHALKTGRGPFSPWLFKLEKLPESCFTYWCVATHPMSFHAICLQ